MQFPVKFQLLIFLWYVGIAGNGNSNHCMWMFFKCSVGTIETAKKRVMQAILTLQNNYIYWPDEQERFAIANRFMSDYEWNKEEDDMKWKGIVYSKSYFMSYFVFYLELNYFVLFIELLCLNF